MANNERIRKYLDAGSVFGQVTRGRAEEIVRELVNSGDIQRSQAQEWVDTLVERSRKTSEQIIEMVRHEVAAQLSRVDGKAIENLSRQVADVLKKSADAGRRATHDATQRAEKTATAARERAGKTASAARKQAGKTASSARKQASQTAGRARAAAEKAVPTRKAAKKPKPAKKTAASKKSAGTKKSASAKRAPAKKAAKSTTAKKSAAKKAR
jgi:polyhydroxyalkanoate synthesis regulator phasin